jgi:hypothetical protein
LKNENDALIKVTGVGICGTDLHILQVPPAHPATKDVILGHKFTGRIVEVGRGIPDFKPAESVLIDPHPGCGQCEATTVIDPRTEDLEAVVSKQLPDGPNIVVEAVGPLLPLAIELVGATEGCCSSATTNR